LTPTCESLQNLEEVAAGTPCTKNHECLRSHLQTLAKVEVVADGRALLCLSEDAWRCRHAIAFGRVMVCMCPVRKLIAATSCNESPTTPLGPARP
jgi:hypothetical protein